MFLGSSRLQPYSNDRNIELPLIIPVKQNNRLILGYKRVMHERERKKQSKSVRALGSSASFLNLT